MTTNPQSKLIAHKLKHTIDLIRFEIDTLKTEQKHIKEIPTAGLASLKKIPGTTNRACAVSRMTSPAIKSCTASPPPVLPSCPSSHCCDRFLPNENWATTPLQPPPASGESYDRRESRLFGVRLSLKINSTASRAAGMDTCPTFRGRHAGCA